jgi:hypothetical protein
MSVGLAFQQTMIVGLVLQQALIMHMAFQQALFVGLALQQSLIVGLVFKQAMIVGLVLTTSSDYRYGLPGGHDCRTAFRASCDISFHGPVNIYNNLIVLLTDNPGL